MTSADPTRVAGLGEGWQRTRGTRSEGHSAHDGGLSEESRVRVSQPS
jgi:hypothetical protein